MSSGEQQAVDLLARLVEDRPNTLAAVAEDCHGAYCVYCGSRGYEDRPRPDHREDCPVEQGQRLLALLHGDRADGSGDAARVREIRVRFPG